ncbi:MAG TPA: undecaprenyldiphospho-muramoylpentapeptide beta-N-acetylglucosaminyltransferase [Polyangiaceae bacterium]|nr:undecaprenyldiphospho-muramoylpentapeptide beta-N-acetylglucosaminyltransferase [Polyangiaceae bacterium]
MSPTIAIAGGGTGGHVFPAVAVAEALRALSKVDVVFFGTERGLEARVVPERGFRLEMLRVEPLRGRGAGRALRASAVALRATVESLSRVKRLGPQAMLSVGGYAAGPVSLAAGVLRIPIAVLEPNSVVGLTNRILGPVARRAYIAWDDAAGAFRERALRPFGVPLRPGFTPRPYVSGSPSLKILVLGGSQGAALLNERIPESIARLASRRVPAPRVLHQAGRDREDRVRAAYARAGVREAVVTAFIDDVAGAIADADLVVSRAGAGAIAEITSIGRASLLVPLPHAADDHQTKNALALVQRGAAACLAQGEASAERLAGALERLLGDESARVSMADAARSAGRPDAARDVASDLLGLAEGAA